MKIGISTWGMPEVPVDEVVSYLGGLGFEAVELTTLPGYTTALEELDAAERRRIRRLFDDSGIGLPAVTVHTEMLAHDAAVHAENWARLTASVDLCAEWADGSGWPVLVTTVGGRPEDWDTRREMIVERVSALARFAGERGVTVALEPHVGNALDLPEKALWLMENVTSPYMKLNFDISHFEIIGIPTADSVRMLAPHSVHTHVKDNRGNEFVIPGEGTFDFVGYLNAMHEAGYTGVVAAEVSMRVQRRPDYDPMSAAALCYETLERAFREAGIRSC